MNSLLIKLVNLYQTYLSPLLHRGQVHCIYPVPCSEYAKRKLQKDPFLIALPKIIYRLLSCNPINALLREKRHH